MGATTPGVGGAMMDTVMGLVKNWWFWAVVALAVVALILFIWAVAMTAQRDKLKKELEALKAGTTASYRRSGYNNTDPGLPATVDVANEDANRADVMKAAVSNFGARRSNATSARVVRRRAGSQYEAPVAGIGQDATKVLAQAMNT